MAQGSRPTTARQMQDLPLKCAGIPEFLLARASSIVDITLRWRSSDWLPSPAATESMTLRMTWAKEPDSPAAQVALIAAAMTELTEGDPA
ncbi:hypothetical protein [Arthrobacter sp. ZGTC412]|uniref:hypothetical protein n=1 Tax=Arthrobacter sp. ZGTC412 TaxID=2058900 RepID=UPI000CE2EBBA|nr:hypothetical protein [Arthrobacter sp. ZGTC412]